MDPGPLQRGLSLCTRRAQYLQYWANQHPWLSILAESIWTPNFLFDLILNYLFHLLKLFQFPDFDILQDAVKIILPKTHDVRQRESKAVGQKRKKKNTQTHFWFLITVCKMTRTYLARGSACHHLNEDITHYNSILSKTPAIHSFLLKQSSEQGRFVGVQN